MTDAPKAPVRAWIGGGLLLILSVVLQMAQASAWGVGGAAFDASSVLLWLSRAALAASLLVFAFGWKGEGSVIARRPVGVIALVVLAFMPLTDLIWIAIPYEATPSDILLWLNYTLLAVWLAAAIIAVAAVARAGVIARPWNIAPAIGLAVVAGTGALLQVVGVSTGADGMGFGLLRLLNELVMILVPVLLGVLALVLGLRPAPPAEPTPVQVYPTVSE